MGEPFLLELVFPDQFVKHTIQVIPVFRRQRKNVLELFYTPGVDVGQVDIGRGETGGILQELSRFDTERFPQE